MEEYFLKKEGLIDKTKTLTTEELRNEILDNTGNLINEGFKPFDNGGSFKYFEISDLDFQINRSEFYWPVIRDEKNNIIGVAAIVKHDNEENLVNLYFLSIKPDYQGKGLASKLVEEIFRFLKNNKLSLKMSSYTSQDSWNKLRHLFERYSKKYNVELFENDKKMGWE